MQGGETYKWWRAPTPVLCPNALALKGLMNHLQLAYARNTMRTRLSKPASTEAPTHDVGGESRLALVRQQLRCAQQIPTGCLRLFRAARLGAVASRSDIAQYHWNEFAQFGLPPDTFGGTPRGPNAPSIPLPGFNGPYFLPGTWCPNCTL